MKTLQHRGQDAAGMITYSDKFHAKRGLGLVEEVFKEEKLSNLKGTIGVGHTRYPTVGAGTFVQPFISTYPYGIAMAHNGNVVNFDQLQSNLKERMRYLTSDCDLELILNLFSDELGGHRFSKEAVFDSIQGVFEQVDGAYSVVAVIADKGLLAFKDPRGIKPLIFGEKYVNGKKGFAFASEDIALNSLGYGVSRDLKPGEAIFVDTELNAHFRVIQSHAPAPCMFEWVYFARAESRINGRSVYDVRQNLGRGLAKKLKGIRADLVSPVPDTSITASIILAEELGLPYREALIKDRYVGRSFIMGSPEKRENAVLRKLNPIYSEIRGKDLILVDDSIVRGTTSRKIVKMLKDKGARKVHLVSTCPPLKYPCYYGIDFPLQSELISTNRGNEQIRQEIGADSVTYQDISSLEEAIGLGVCKACLTGEYPTPIQESKTFAERRIKDRK